MSFAQFGAQPVHLIVVSFDSDYFCAVDGSCGDLVLLQVVWNENVRRQSCGRRVCCHRIGQVSSRGAAHRGELKLQRLVYRDCGYTVFEGERWRIDAVILDVKLVES